MADEAHQNPDVSRSSADARSHDLGAGIPAVSLDEISAYDYVLPAELVAQHPLPQRDASRLLVVDRSAGAWEHRAFRDLPSYLSAGDVAVFNTTKVLPAKLHGIRESTGGRWSGLFLGSLPDGRWRIIGKTRGKLVVGERLALHATVPGPDFHVILHEKTDDGWLVIPETRDPAEVVLSRIGEMPLPPYIDRTQPEVSDEDRYQTVYAETPGAVAAPTAGLHFTTETLSELDARGVRRSEVTLHVGVGTFRPVTAERLDDHVMHHEWAELSDEAASEINAARSAGNRCLAVGTTAVRTLETAAGLKGLSAYCGDTDLFIRPPYDFQAVDCMLTNFHLPRSTLLVLVSAFAGRDLMLEAYAAAVHEQYRFFSYGDAMLIL